MTCRGGLADGKFRWEARKVLVNRLGRPKCAGLLARCRELLPAIEGRIRPLRARVWW